jgi:hypothetical protein
MTDKKSVSPYLDGNNVLKPGNPGRPKGAKDRAPRGVRTAVRKNAASIHLMAEKHMPEILEALAREAKTNHVAAANFIRLVAPVAPKSFVEGAGIIADLPLEDRLAALSALVARGEVDVASGTALAGIIKAEIEYRYVRPLKAAVRELEQSLKTGDRRAAEAALQQLARELNTITPAMDAEIVE